MPCRAVLRGCGGVFAFVLLRSHTREEEAVSPGILGCRDDAPRFAPLCTARHGLARLGTSLPAVVAHAQGRPAATQPGRLDCEKDCAAVRSGREAPLVVLAAHRRRWRIIKPSLRRVPASEKMLKAFRLEAARRAKHGTPRSRCEPWESNVPDSSASWRQPKVGPFIQ